MDNNQSPAVTEKQPSRQFEAFESRVKNNVGLLQHSQMSAEAFQFWNERPQLIRAALYMGFSTRLVRDEANARQSLERFIWATPCGKESWSDDDIFRAKKLLIWFLRQSKNLTEEVVLHSPFDPDDRTEEIVKFAMTTSYFVNSLLSSFAPYVDIGCVMDGIGCPLSLQTGGSNSVAHFYLMRRDCRTPKARRVHWKDAMEGLEKIEPPKAA